MAERILVGRAGRPPGPARRFVVERPSDDPQRFAVGARLVAGGEPAEVVESKRVGGGRIAIRVGRRGERGTDLEIERSELPEPEDDTYYIFQLVGLVVVEEDGRELGRVED